MQINIAPLYPCPPVLGENRLLTSLNASKQLIENIRDDSNLPVTDNIIVYQILRDYLALNHMHFQPSFHLFIPSSDAIVLVLKYGQLYYQSRVLVMICTRLIVTRYREVPAPMYTFGHHHSSLRLNISCLIPCRPAIPRMSKDSEYRCFRLSSYLIGHQRIPIKPYARFTLETISLPYVAGNARRKRLKCAHDRAHMPN